MFSSQDSDVDLQCKRTIKPKKLITRCNQPLFINGSATPIILNDDSLYPQKQKPRKLTTQSSQNDGSDSNEEKKIAKKWCQQGRPFPQWKKKITFDIDPSKGQEQTEENSQNSKSKDKSITNSIKIGLLVDDSERQKQQVQIDQLSSQKSQEIQRAPRKAKTCKGSYGFRQKTSKVQYSRTQLKQKTTPILSNYTNNSEIIRQYIKNGNKIRTDWVKNLINGFTQIEYYDKGKFRGIFNQGDLVSGQITFSNHFVQTGNFSSFTFHGLGKLKFPSGQLFQGNWVYGCLQGKGKITYPKGQIYCGQISNFRRQGQGNLYFVNGDKYIGQFSNGQITGLGELHKNGKITHKGLWLKGKFFGQDYEKYKQEKQRICQAERRRKIQNTTKASMLRQSMRKIQQIHELMNDQSFVDQDNGMELSINKQISLNINF